MQNLHFVGLCYVSALFYFTINPQSLKHPVARYSVRSSESLVSYQCHGCKQVKGPPTLRQLQLQIDVIGCHGKENIPDFGEHVGNINTGDHTDVI